MTTKVRQTMLGPVLTPNSPLARTVSQRFGDVTNVKDFGAVGDGITDDTAAIHLALAQSSEVYIPTGIYLVTGITIPPNTTLFGASAQDGWARQATYTNGAVLRLADNSDTSVVTVESVSPNCSLQNVTIDGNKDNQTSFMSHGIRTHFGVIRSTGQAWHGLRVVNCKGFSGYFEGGPCQITDSFFMSGAFFNRVTDLKVSNCDFDGTDGFHPSFWMNESDGCNVSDCFIWGWGEVAGGLQSTKTANATIDTGTDFITATGDWLHNDTPITLFSADVWPEGSAGSHGRFTTWFLQHEGGDLWSLWSRPADNGGRQQLNFTTTGTNVVIGWGHEETGLITDTFGCAVNNTRFAGTQGEALRLYDVRSSSFNGIRLWGMNYRLLTNQAAVRLFDCSLNVFSNCMLGERIGFQAKIESAIACYSVDKACDRNIFDKSNQLFNVLGPNLLVDETDNDYMFRNKYDLHVQPDVGTERVNDTNFFLEPGKQLWIGHQGATTVPANTNTLCNLEVIRGTGIATTSANTLTMTVTPFGLYEIKGVLQLAGHDATLTSIKCDITLGGMTRTLNVPSPGPDDGHGLSIPFNFNWMNASSSESSEIVRVQLFTKGGGGSMTLANDSTRSSISVTKLADLHIDQ